MKNEKVKVGQKVQSFHVTMPVCTSRGSIIGTVVRVEVDPSDGVEYVYINAEVEIDYKGFISSKQGEYRAPQNGTPCTNGRVTDGIHIYQEVK